MDNIYFNICAGERDKYPMVYIATGYCEVMARPEINQMNLYINTYSSPTAIQTTLLKHRLKVSGEIIPLSTIKNHKYKLPPNSTGTTGKYY